MEFLHHTTSDIRPLATNFARRLTHACKCLADWRLCPPPFSEAVPDAPVAHRRNIRFCRVRVFRIGDVILKNLRFMMAELLPGERRYEGGLLPLTLI